MNPYHIPADQEVPEPLDFAFSVFSTDFRVIEFCEKRFEVKRGDDETMKRAIIRLWHLAKSHPPRPINSRGYRPPPELVWYEEARLLGERVGRRWETTPIPTLVSALADNEMLIPLGFPEVTLPAGNVVHVSTSPYVLFRGRRLIMGTEDECRDLVIHDLKVGKNCMFYNSHGIPACCFSTTAFPYRLKLDTCQISQLMTLAIENRGTTPRKVKPMMYGITLDDSYANSYGMVRR